MTVFPLTYDFVFKCPNCNNVIGAVIPKGMRVLEYWNKFLAGRKCPECGIELEVIE